MFYALQISMFYSRFKYGILSWSAAETIIKKLENILEKYFKNNVF